MEYCMMLCLLRCQVVAKKQKCRRQDALDAAWNILLESVCFLSELSQVLEHQELTDLVFRTGKMIRVCSVSFKPQWFRLCFSLRLDSFMFTPIEMSSVF